VECICKYIHTSFNIIHSQLPFTSTAPTTHVYHPIYIQGIPKAIFAILAYTMLVLIVMGAKFGGLLDNSTTVCMFTIL